MPTNPNLKGSRWKIQGGSSRSHTQQPSKSLPKGKSGHANSNPAPTAGRVAGGWPKVEGDRVSHAQKKGASAHTATGKVASKWKHEGNSATSVKQPDILGKHVNNAVNKYFQPQGGKVKKTGRYM